MALRILAAAALVAVIVGCKDAPRPGTYSGGDPALSLDSLRCAQLGEHNQCTLYEASLYDLVTRPREFHGKRVRVIGFAHFEFEGNGLYAHREDWLRALSMNGVWMDPPSADWTRLNNHYLLVEGRFDAKMRGHMGMWSGSIDSVTRYLVWEAAAPGDSGLPVPRSKSQ